MCKPSRFWHPNRFLRDSFGFKFALAIEAKRVAWVILKGTEGTSKQISFWLLLFCALLLFLRVIEQ